MIDVTIHYAQATSWVSLAAPGLSAISFLLASLAFIRSSRVSEFQLYTRLSEQIQDRWSELHKIKRNKDYKLKLVEIFDHYERCATLINDFRIFRGRSLRSLENQIIECLERNWKEPFVRETFAEARSSSETYRQLRHLMKKTKKFCID